MNEISFDLLEDMVWDYLQTDLIDYEIKMDVWGIKTLILKLK